jgi:hypothetical protein
MSSGPKDSSKDKRIHDSDLRLIIAYDHVMLQEWGHKPDAKSPSKPADPTTSDAPQHTRNREYLEGILSILGGDPTALRPGKKVTGAKFTNEALKFDITMLAALRKRRDAPTKQRQPSAPPNPGNPAKWIADYTEAIYYEIAKKKGSHPSASIGRVPSGSEEAKTLALLAAIAKLI